MSAAKTAQALAVISLDHCDYAMPLADATRVIQLFAKAKRLDWHPGGSARSAECWHDRGQPKIAMKCIRADQLHKVPPPPPDEDD